MWEGGERESEIECVCVRACAPAPTRVCVRVQFNGACLNDLYVFAVRL